MRQNGKVDLPALANQALEDRGLSTNFSAEAMREAAAAKEHDFSKLKLPDLSTLPWASIDNDDSRDLDQVQCVQKIDDRTTKILVGIADVASTVARGSALDRHADHNTTSVYTGIKTYPMLPERLSTDLTSLNENQTRLAVVIESVVDKSGKVESFNVYPAIVRNKAQLTYDAVSTWLGDTKSDSEVTRQMLEKIKASPELQAQLKLQDEVAQALKERRHHEGALDFRSQQGRPSVQPDGSIQLTNRDPNRATQLIEEFMVASNNAVDQFLGSHGSPVMQRIVKKPENWLRMVELAKQHGGSLPAEPDGKALQRFLAEERQKDPDRFPDLSLAMIKLMGRGEYAIKGPNRNGIGHFGLAVSHYSHSTAPNRRYPDLITQRLLHAIFDGKPSPYSFSDLNQIAARCTDMEDAANKAERQVYKSMAAVALADRIGDKFSGFITGASDKGVWVRIPDPPVEGKIQGRTDGLKTGQAVEVRLVSTDIERGFIDFEVVKNNGKKRR